jgi:hypothetical protein
MIPHKLGMLPLMGVLDINTCEKCWLLVKLPKDKKLKMIEERRILNQIFKLEERRILNQIFKIEERRILNQIFKIEERRILNQIFKLEERRILNQIFKIINLLGLKSIILQTGEFKILSWISYFALRLLALSKATQKH